MEFSKKYQTWVKEWQKVIFSDEKKFNLDGPDGLHYHWHDLRTAPEILSKRYGGGQSVMMWASFAGNQKLPIQILQGKINSEKYQKNLEDQ